MEGRRGEKRGAAEEGRGGGNRHGTYRSQFRQSIDKGGGQNLILHACDFNFRNVIESNLQSTLDSNDSHNEY